MIFVKIVWYCLVVLAYISPAWFYLRHRDICMGKENRARDPILSFLVLRSGSLDMVLMLFTLGFFYYFFLGAFENIFFFIPDSLGNYDDDNEWSSAKNYLSSLSSFFLTTYLLSHAENLIARRATLMMEGLEREIKEQLGNISPHQFDWYQYNKLSRLYMKLGKGLRMIPHLEKCIELNPDSKDREAILKFIDSVNKLNRL